MITALRRYKGIDLSFGMVKSIQDKIPMYVNFCLLFMNYYQNIYLNMKIVCRRWVGEDKADVIASFGFATGLWFGTVLVRKYSLQALYSYHGWMYEARNSVSLKTKLWSVS